MQSSAHNDVASLNLQMLLHFRCLLKDSPAEAQIRFGYTAEQANAVMAMDQDSLKEIANSGLMLFTLQIPNAPQLRAV